MSAPVWLELQPTATPVLPTPVLPTPVTCDVGDGCITCGDVAVLLTVTELRGADALCRDDDGRTELVATELVAGGLVAGVQVGGVQVGDRLLVHAGVALERLPALAPAHRTTEQEEPS